MENSIYRTIYEQFYKLTEGRFYTKKEKKKIMHLLCWANGVKDESTKMFNASMELENAEIFSYTDIQNVILFESVSDEKSAFTYDAASVIAEMIEKKEIPENYLNKAQWYRATASRENAIDRALIAYARGDYERAIDAFQDVDARGEMPILEYITISAYMQKDYKLAYEYAIMAQQIDGYTKMDIPWMSQLEREVESHLSKDDRESIRNKALIKCGRTGTVGFIS